MQGGCENRVNGLSRASPQRHPGRLILVIKDARDVFRNYFIIGDEEELLLLTIIQNQITL